MVVTCHRDGLKLERTGPWDTLGFRGTCSKGYRLHAEGDGEAVLSAPYAQISGQTMLPVSHILWASAWLGLAEAAMDRSRRFVQAAARSKPAGAVPSSATRLAAVLPRLHQLRALVQGALVRWDALRQQGKSVLFQPASVVEFNNLKVSASTLLVEIVSEAMTICGIAGYRSEGPYSIARLLRDAYGASLMVNNDRISQNSAGLLLVEKSV